MKYETISHKLEPSVGLSQEFNYSTLIIYIYIYIWSLSLIYIITGEIRFTNRITPHVPHSRWSSWCLTVQDCCVWGSSPSSPPKKIKIKTNNPSCSLCNLNKLSLLKMKCRSYTISPYRILKLNFNLED